MRISSKPLVTVYVLNHNYAQYLEKCVESLLSQSYSNIELFVIDDGSTDDSIKKLSQYENNPSIRLIRQENIGLVIGLFCSEAFTEKGIDWLAEDLDVPKREISNINIKGRVEIKLRDGREEVRSLKAFGKFARPACLYCMDYAADNADIGLGGIGLNGWTFTVIRTEAGHKAWQALLESGWIETKELSEAPRSKELLIRLSKYKRNRPLPALMPNLEERKSIGNLDPKNYYRGWEDGNSAKDWRPLPPPPPKKKKVAKKEGSA